jgi:hypothetical protein
MHTTKLKRAVALAVLLTAAALGPTPATLAA